MIISKEKTLRSTGSAYVANAYDCARVVQAYSSDGWLADFLFMCRLPFAVNVMLNLFIHSRSDRVLVDVDVHTFDIVLASSSYLATRSFRQVIRHKIIP